MANQLISLWKMFPHTQEPELLQVKNGNQHSTAHEGWQVKLVF